MSVVNILDDLIDQETKQNDAYTASTSERSIDDSNDNWSDAEEIDLYNTESHQNNQNTHTECRVSNGDEWICIKCNFSNNRRIAITENDCKCVKCKADLSVAPIEVHDKCIN
eukprot:18848_1